MNNLIRFYEIDLTRVKAGILYFHPGLNELGKNMVWGGREYLPFPISIEGLEYDGQGRLPRPTLTVSNISGEMKPGMTCSVGSLVREANDLNGCKLIHRMTLSRYLDDVNFINGNPERNSEAGNADNAESLIEFPKEIYIFERKIEETSEYIKFELASVLDLEGQKLPKRNYNANYCAHKYRGDLCGYQGTKYFDMSDAETEDPKNDKCGRRLSSCELRFGKGNELPFGGFPGVGLLS
jgi:lambda family phage minor tail protein L